MQNIRKSSICCDYSKWSKGEKTINSASNKCEIIS